MMGPESKRLGEGCSILSWSGGRVRDPRIMRDVHEATEYRRSEIIYGYEQHCDDRLIPVLMETSR